MSPLSAGIINREEGPAYPNSIIAAYPIGTVENETLIDASGNGYDGSVSGATLVSTDDGSALSFDGVDDTVSIPAALHSVEQGTVDIFVTPSTSSSSGAASIYLESSDGNSDGGSYGSGGNDFSIGAQNGEFRINYDHDSEGYYPHEVTESYSPGNMRRITVVYRNGDVLEVYADGGTSPVASAGLDDGTFAPFVNETLLGGTLRDNRHFEGLIHELNVYDTPLTPSEIDG